MALWELHDLSCSLGRAVELLLDLLVVLHLSGRRRKFQSGVEVLEVELEDEHDVVQGVEFAELFELLG